MTRIENPKNTERGRNAIPPRREFISPTHLFFYFPFLTQLQSAFIIGTSYAIAKLGPKRVRGREYNEHTQLFWIVAFADNIACFGV